MAPARVVKNDGVTMSVDLPACGPCRTFTGSFGLTRSVPKKRFQRILIADTLLSARHEFPTTFGAIPKGHVGRSDVTNGGEGR